jgi:hypothetical protein
MKYLDVFWEGQDVSCWITGVESAGADALFYGIAGVAFVKSGSGPCGLDIPQSHPLPSAGVLTQTVRGCNALAGLSLR